MTNEALSQQTPFSTIDEAIRAIAGGEIVIVVDDPDRENEGDFVMAAEWVTPESVNFMVTHGRGLLCLPIDASTADRLELRPMCAEPATLEETAFTVSIDLKEPANTGISAFDRARTTGSARPASPPRSESSPPWPSNPTSTAVSTWP
jgi:3,4-dihydroxy 2-butanone 4-phosphate synthase/GTP cyclohydrolase II